MGHRELIRRLTALHGAGEARAIVRTMAEERFGLSQADLLLGREEGLSAAEREVWEQMSARLLAGEPVQHVLGYADFCGRRFRVTPDVLIPRPETEELVRLGTEVLSHRMATFDVLDLCTGSGCIAVSLALALPGAQVVGVDISEAALAVAQENVCALGAAHVVLEQADVLAFPPGSEHSLALITANPPYVRQSEAAEMSATVVEHEPHLALFVPDTDPLCFYRAIAAVARRRLEADGVLIVEANCTLTAETATLLSSHGFADVRVLPDAFGRPRFVLARQPS